MGVCLCIYGVFVLFCLYVAALRRADLPSKESYRLCIGLRNWKNSQGPTKGCRAIDRQKMFHEEHEIRRYYVRFSGQWLFEWPFGSWLIPIFRKDGVPLTTDGDKSRIENLHIPPKTQYPSTRLHGVTTQKTKNLNKSLWGFFLAYF
jgi:hypothetical protein